MVYFCLPICWASIAVNLTKFGGDVPTPFTDQREFGVEEMKLMCSSTSNCWRINVVFRTCGAKNTSLTKFWTLGFSCATDVLFSSIAVMWIDLIQAVKSFTSNASLFFAYFKTAVERTFVPYTLNRGTRNTAGSYRKMVIISQRQVQRYFNQQISNFQCKCMFAYVRVSTNEVSSPNDSGSPFDSSNGRGSAAASVATENTSKITLGMLPRHIISANLTAISR